MFFKNKPFPATHIVHYNTNCCILTGRFYTATSDNCTLAKYIEVEYKNGHVTFLPEYDIYPLQYKKSIALELRK